MGPTIGQRAGKAGQWFTVMSWLCAVWCVAVLTAAGATAGDAKATTPAPAPTVSTTPIPVEVSTVAQNSTDAETHVNQVQLLLAQAPPASAEDEDKIDLSPSSIGGRSILPRQQYGSNSCRAPTGETGSCGTVRDCPGIYRIRDATYLRSFLCGYAGQTPLVCCPTRWTPTYYYGYQTTTTARPAYQYGTTRPAYVPTSAPTRAPVVAGPSSSIGERRPPKPAILPKVCGTAHGNSRIVGGSEAIPGSYPWMAAIYIQTGASWSQACGGALVSHKHVVTAAHCVVSGSRSQNLPNRLFLIRLGDHNLVTTDDLPAGSTIDVKVGKISRHSDFDSKTYKNDIAIMELETDVQFSQYIQPLCLPYDAIYGNLEEEYAIVTGWGYTKYEGQGSNVLKQATIRIWPEAECKEAFKREVTITPEYLCAGDGEGKKDSCQGDSGGPLVYNEGTRYYLIGVVSFGKKCATPGYPGAYTRVTKYLKWLNDHF